MNEPGRTATFLENEVRLHQVRVHSEAEADRLLRRGLKVLGLKDVELGEMPKGAERKQVLAWWLGKETVVSREWISERLEMGDASRVTKAFRNVDTRSEPTLVSLRKQLENCS